MSTLDVPYKSKHKSSKAQVFGYSIILTALCLFVAHIFMIRYSMDVVDQVDSQVSRRYTIKVTVDGNNQHNFKWYLGSDMIQEINQPEADCYRYDFDGLNMVIGCENGIYYFDVYYRVIDLGPANRLLGYCDQMIICTFHLMPANGAVFEWRKLTPGEYSVEAEIVGQGFSHSNAVLSSDVEITLSREFVLLMLGSDDGDHIKYYISTRGFVQVYDCNINVCNLRC